MFPTLKHFGVGVIPWSPLARGLLTRPFNGETTTKRGDEPWVFFVLATSMTQCHLRPQVHLQWLPPRARYFRNS